MKRHEKYDKQANHSSFRQLVLALANHTKQIVILLMPETKALREAIRSPTVAQIEQWIHTAFHLHQTDIQVSSYMMDHTRQSLHLIPSSLSDHVVSHTATGQLSQSTIHIHIYDARDWIKDQYFYDYVHLGSAGRATFTQIIMNHL